MTQRIDITSITPSVGSAAGGTIVNITGTGFVKNATMVTIGGTKHHTNISVIDRRKKRNNTFQTR